MSYDIRLTDPATRETIQFQSPHQMRGGIRAIYSLSGAESIPILQHAISAMEGLKEDRKVRERIREQGAGGYWLPTKENAVRPLHQLLAMARMRPDGVWEGD